MDSVQKRRMEISKMIAKGLTTPVIAKKLNLPIFVVRSDRVALSSLQPEPATLSPVKKTIFASIDDRRETIREMHLRGMDDPSIAAELGMTKNMVWRDRNVLGLTPHKSPERLEHRVSEVMRLAEQDLTTSEIAKALGVSPMSVNRYFRRAGIQVQEKSEIRDNRVTEVKRLVEQNFTTSEIAKRLGVSTTSVARYYRIAGIQRSDIGERRETVRTMLDQNAPVPVIANALGVAMMTVYRDIKALEKAS